MHEIEISSHHGITVYSAAREGVVTGTLMFGVGYRDQPTHKAGIAHLFEHVILRMVQPVTIDHGGLVNEDSTEFYATGEGEAVATFLNSIARAVSELSSVSDAQIELEKSVIEAEDIGNYRSASAGLLTFRFGARGVGNAHFGAPTTLSISREEIVDWGATWFTAANTVLSIDGPVPANFDIQLPNGGHIKRKPPAEPAVSTPRLIKSAKSGVALSLLVPSNSAMLLAGALVFELLAKLRHELALIYSVQVFETHIDRGNSQLDLVLDPVDSRCEATLRECADLIRELATHGITEAAAAYSRNSALSELGQEENALSAYLDRLSVDTLLGRETPSRQELLDLAKSITATELTDALEESVSSLIVAIDREIDLRKGDEMKLDMVVDDFKIWQTGEFDDAEVRRRPGQRKWTKGNGRSSMWLTDTHLVRRKSGEISAIPLADVVLVGDRTCKCVVLMDTRGRSVELNFFNWNKRRSLRRRVLDAFPVEIVRNFPEEL